MANPSMVIRVSAQIEQLKANIAETKAQIEGVAANMAQSAEKSSAVFQERWAAFTVSAGAAAAGVKGVASEVSGWMTAASESEAATARLTAALQAQGTFTPELLAQYTDLAGGLQKTTTNADELTVEMQALLVQVGHVMPDQMAGALKAAMDLSTGLKIDLPAATMLLSKALGTGGESLGRLKGLLGDTEIAGEGADAVLAAINSKFGGQAQAAADTYAGKLTIVHNQMGEMQEKAGALLASVLLPLLNWFTSMPESMQMVIAGGGLLIGVLAPLGMAVTGIVSAFTLLMPVLAIAAPAALGAVTAAFTVLAPFLLPAGAIIAGITAVYLAFKHWDEITEFARQVYAGVKLYLVDQFNAIVESIRSKIAAVTGFFSGMYDAVVGHSIVPEMIAGIAVSFAALQGAMVDPAVTATHQATAAFEQLSDGTDALRSNLHFTAETIETEFAAVEETVTRTAASFTEAMAMVSAGQGTMTGTIQADLSAAGKASTQKAWDENRYYGPVIGGGPHNPHGTGPDFAALGYKALGGPVSSGMPYVVGERGPELFVPERSGTIVPNGGAGNITLAPTLNFHGPVIGSAGEFQRMVNDALLNVFRSTGRPLPGRA